MNKKASGLADTLSWALPWKTAMLDREPSEADMWKNILGVGLVTTPLVAIAAYLSNKYKMDEMREAIDKNAISNVNSKIPVLSPDSTTGNLADEKKQREREISAINSKLNKKASVGSDILTNTVKRTVPMLTAPLATWATAVIVNKLLRYKYAQELDEENAKLQDMQNALDMQELERLGYIKRDTNGTNNPVTPGQEGKINKKASILTLGGDILRGTGDWLSTLGGVIKKGGIDFPLALALLGTTGLSAYGIHHFLKETDDMKKLKLLKKRMLGSDKLLGSPSIMVKLPKGYEETGKKTEQILPGISPALIPNNVIEDAQIVEKPKKDAFLG